MLLRMSDPTLPLSHNLAKFHLEQLAPDPQALGTVPTEGSEGVLSARIRDGRVGRVLWPKFGQLRGSSFYALNMIAVR